MPKKLSLALGIVFLMIGIAGCVADDPPQADVAEVTTETTSETTAELAVDPSPADDSVCASNATGAAAPGCCSGTQGCPVPIRLENQWLACRVICIQHGGTYHGCRTACCQEWVNCPNCYQQ